MPDIAGILGQARPREAVVPICLAGDVAGEVDRLQGELASFADGWQASSMGDVDPRLGLVREIEAAREQMRAASVEFRLKALGHRAFSNLMAAHPAPQDSKGDPYDASTFLPALLAACCTDPVMSREHVFELLDVLNDGQARQLLGAALAVNEEPSPLPFS